MKSRLRASQEGVTVTEVGSTRGQVRSAGSSCAPEASVWMTKRVQDTTLREVADKLAFEPHRLRLDQSGRYDETLDREFPFLIKLFGSLTTTSRRFIAGAERLELSLCRWMEAYLC